MSAGTPKELKNYIIKSPEIEKAYAAATDAKDDFKIYKLEIREYFALGDALFMENVYYLENAENLQLTLRSKNGEIKRLLDAYGLERNDSAFPFKFYLKVSATNTGSEDGSGWDYVILEPVNDSAFGKDTDRYSYLTVSFDGVKIDYANTKVELYMLLSGEPGEVVFDENETVARFTLFDINMPKTKIAAKKFKLN